MIKLLVVDDSPLVRRLLGELFADEGDFTLAFARNGAEALEALGTFEPDVITLDVQMPQMDGLTCLDRIMVLRPTPVVVASSITTPGGDEALRALELGAVDVIAKPTGAISLRMEEFGPALVEKVRAAAGARLPRSLRLRDRLRAGVAVRPAGAPAVAPSPRRRAVKPLVKAGSWRAERGVVLIGASTGGPSALDAVLEQLPADFPWPVVIAQHMPALFTGALARRLDGLTALTVTEVVEPTLIQPGFAYIARGDADILISARRDGVTVLGAPSDASRRWHPSVDRLVDSALTQIRPDALIGVLLTGMGNDGAGAMTRLKAAGGHTIAQNEDSSVVWGMPGELVRAEGASRVVALEAIGKAVVEAVSA